MIARPRHALKLGACLAVAVCLFAKSAQPAQAFEWHGFWWGQKFEKKEDRHDFGRGRDDKWDDEKPSHDSKDKGGKGSTTVKGTVFGPDDQPVSGGGSVSVHCGSATKTSSIGADGKYSVKFTQVECKKGDTASASAATDQGSGSGTAAVQDTEIDGPCASLDLAVIDINVPEFGVLGGVISAVGAGGSYLLFLKRG